MASSLNYTGGLTCALEVANIDEGISFYRDVLGFELIYKMDEMAWCELKTEVANVNVGLSEVENAGGKGGATLTFGVKNVDDARRELEGKGVRFDGENQVIEGMVKLATFYDPSGNALMLYEDLAQK